MPYQTPTINEKNSVTEILLDMIQLSLASGFTGLATEAKQDTGNTTLASILAKIIAAPATEAKQDTGNTFLSTIADKFYNKGSEFCSVIENITDSTTGTLYAAQGAGVRAYITSILVTNKHASVGTMVQIKGNGTIWSGYAAPNGGGFSCSFPTPLKANSANYALQYQCTTTGADVAISVSGFKE